MLREGSGGLRSTCLGHRLVRRRRGTGSSAGRTGSLRREGEQAFGSARVSSAPPPHARGSQPARPRCHSLQRLRRGFGSCCGGWGEGARKGKMEAAAVRAQPGQTIEREGGEGREEGRRRWRGLLPRSAFFLSLPSLPPTGTAPPCGFLPGHSLEARGQRSGGK